MSNILQGIESPEGLKGLSYPELEKLASEIRQMLVSTVSENGGHLASSLGVVELTLALHRVFDSPQDKIIWDVGHQAYAHKLITGRKDRFSTLRRSQGLSGFPTRSESVHDPFGTGHAGTSVSAAMGMAMARDLAGLDYDVISVIGDGSLGTGMALEALNHAGQLGTKMIVVLNDNGIAISPTVGAISGVLNRVRFDARYEVAKRTAKKTILHLPLGKGAWTFSTRVKEYVKGVLLPSRFWEDLGFVYLGPVDGYNLKDMEAALGRARNYESKPTLVHVLTTKGKGYSAAEANATKFHGLPARLTQNNAVNDAPTYSQVFGQTVTRLMRENKKIIAITAAMLDGTGLTQTAAEFPDRVIDVGICEQHAVTLAAGLATQGFIPIVAIYSTFLQRSYDQIIHDVCIQNLPVIFAVDRAGIVGEDGKTHQGSLDLSFMRIIPGMIVACPRDENELQDLLFTAINCGGPMAIRYPRGHGSGSPLRSVLYRLPIGKGEILRQGQHINIMAIGAAVQPSLEAADVLAKEGIDCTVADARFAKPLDTELVTEMARAERLLTVEENVLAGGFGSAVLEFVRGLDHQATRVECLGLPDEFIEHGTQESGRSKYGLDANGIARRVRSGFPELFLRNSTTNVKGKR